MYEDFKVKAENENMPSLDVLFTFAYSSSVSGSNHPKLYYNSVCPLAEYNLKLKYNYSAQLDSKAIELLEDEKLRYGFRFTSQNRLNLQKSIFLNYESLIKKDIIGRLDSLSERDKQVIKFVLKRISEKTDEWEYKKAHVTNENEMISVPNLSVITEDGNINGYSISSGKNEDCKFWTEQFNKNFKQCLGNSSTITISDTLENCGNITTRENELIACELGDIVVKSGLGYWVPWVPITRNVHLELVLPKALYDIGMKYMDTL